MRAAGITRSYRKTLKTRIAEAKQPLSTAKALVNELGSRVEKPTVDLEPERVDYSDRTADLGRTYRKIAPEMQEADLAAELLPLQQRYSPTFPQYMEPWDGNRRTELTEIPEWATAVTS